MRFDNEVSDPLWVSSVGTFSNISCYDVEIKQPDNEILVPVIENCGDCNGAGDNSGSGYIYKLDDADGSDLMGTIDLSVNDNLPVQAYDLRIGITNTSDGGFAVVSSKQPYSPPVAYQCSTMYDCVETLVDINTNWWNTDAYVAKFSSNFVLEWDTTFDEDADPPEEWPGDQKKQECLYAITETEDGGLVISGNYSSNFDDCYLVKLYKNCNNELTFDMDGNGSEILVSDLPGYNSPTTTIPAGTYLVRGSIHIKDGENVFMGNGVVMKFADSKRCGVETNIIVEPGGYLLLEGTALLTSLYAECPGSMWDGIEVWGDPNQTQGVDNDGSFEMTEDATIENATMGVMADIAGYNSNGVRNPSETGGGGIITIDGGHFINCRRYVHFAPHYLKHVKYNLSTIANCEFSCTGPLEDPAYHDAFGTPLGVNTFITINQARRIVIDNNSFTNSGDFLHLARGYGIISHEAGGEFKNNQFYNFNPGY